MNISLSKKTILYSLVYLWIVFSIIYIIDDIWSDFKNVQMQQAYEQGRIDTINSLIREAEKCQPIPVFGEEKQVQLMNVDCPQSPGPEK